MKLQESYGFEINVKYISLSAHPEVTDILPVQAIPTQYIFDADGNPWRPASFDLGATYELVTDDAGNHIFTRHVGLLTYDQLVAIATDLTAP